MTDWIKTTRVWHALNTDNTRTLCGKENTDNLAMDTAINVDIESFGDQKICRTCEKKLE